MADVQLSSIDEDTLDTILAPDFDFDGDMVFKEPLMIKGRVRGSIVTESDLHIDTGATVEADISACNVTVRGVLKGNVSATGRVELFSSCRVDGDIRAVEVTMEPGCRFNGVCSMTGPVDAPQA
ncbi:MAG: polymer-forming cytoskeletal protein [Spirochaetales bacterium]|nr:polymer-forming cytoskeletal protein [Spirochaetales bacterium]